MPQPSKLGAIRSTIISKLTSQNQANTKRLFYNYATKEEKRFYSPISHCIRADKRLYEPHKASREGVCYYNAARYTGAGRALT